MCIRPHNTIVLTDSARAIAERVCQLGASLMRAKQADRYAELHDFCEHGRGPECDDCNEQRGADIAEQGIGR